MVASLSFVPDVFGMDGRKGERETERGKSRREREFHFPICIATHGSVNLDTFEVGPDNLGGTT